MEVLDQEDILAEASAFAEQVLRPQVVTFEEEGGVSQEVISMMAERGYLAATFPVEYGGLGLDPIEYGKLTATIGKECSSTRSILTVHTSLVGQSLLRWGSSDQKERFLPFMARGEKLAAFALSEPETGSDAQGVQTTYTKQGNAYLLNGVKKWITMGALADILLVIAAKDGEVTAFLVDSTSVGVQVKPMKGIMVTKGAYVAEISLENVHVPAENVLGNVGNGFSFVTNTALDHGRYSIAWGGIGIAEAALDAMIAYARRRKQAGRRIYEFQLVQEMIGEAMVKLEAGRALCIKAGMKRKENVADYVIQTTMAKYYTAKVANQIAADALQVHGGNGFSNEYPVERLFREAKLLEVIEGTSQVLIQNIAMHGLSKRSNRNYK